MPLVSVIVPNYNHERFLNERLDSIFSQTFEDFEVILLDDNSSDKSFSILEGYRDHPKVSFLYQNQSNSGSAFGLWQVGLKQAQGKYIWIAETDDFAEPQFLEHTVRVFEEMESVTLVYSDARIVDEHSDQIGLWSDEKNSFFKTDRWSDSYIGDGVSEIVDYLLYKVTINNVSSVLFRRSNLESMDFNTLLDFKNVGDLFTYSSVLLQGDISYVALPLNNFRIHEQNTTKVNVKSGVFYIEAINCYEIIFNAIINNPYLRVKKEEINKASNYIINRFGFKLVDHGYLKRLMVFIKTLKRYRIFSTWHAFKLIIAHKMYSSKNRGLMYWSKKIIKASSK